MARARIIYGRKNRYFADEREVTREEFDRLFPTRIKDLLSSGRAPDGHRSSCWPQKGSDALCVQPQQIAEAHQLARDRGVSTEFTREGQPIFTSQRHRRDYCQKVETRVVDRNGSYGDPT
jgi:hypothetical protein